MTSRWDHMDNSVRGVGQEGDPVRSFTKSPTRRHFELHLPGGPVQSATLVGVGIRLQLGSCLCHNLVGAGSECTAAAQDEGHRRRRRGSSDWRRSFAESPPSGNSSSVTEPGAADACSARGRFCELFDLSRWCSVVRRPGLLGGWASANIVFDLRGLVVSRKIAPRGARQTRMARTTPIEWTRLIRSVAAKHF